jgi:hypothetical protein
MLYAEHMIEVNNIKYRLPYHVTDQLTCDAGGAVSQEEDGRESGKSWETTSTSGRKQSPNF